MNVDLNARDEHGYITATYPPKKPVPQTGEVVILYDGDTRCQGIVSQKRSLNGSSCIVVSFTPFWGTAEWYVNNRWTNLV